MDDMLTTRSRLRILPLLLVLFVLILTSCSNGATPTNELEPQAAEATTTPTPDEPTPTPIPAAAIVNDERLPLTWFENELARYLLAQESLGTPVEDQAETRTLILDDLIDQMLLAQGAIESGFAVTDEDVQSRIDLLAAEVDLSAWMAAWRYSEDDLFQMLRLQMLAAAKRGQIIESVPKVQEQVEIRQVLTRTSAGASEARTKLNSGVDFEEVALIYQAETGGYLGWVPRGYLLIPEVEEAAFNLPVGVFSETIESEIGYHIVLVLDRAERPLSQDALLTLQRQAVYRWVEETRETSKIEVLID